MTDPSAELIVGAPPLNRVDIRWTVEPNNQELGMAITLEANAKGRYELNLTGWPGGLRKRLAREPRRAWRKRMRGDLT